MTLPWDWFIRTWISFTARNGGEAHKISRLDLSRLSHDQIEDLHLPPEAKNQHYLKQELEARDVMKSFPRGDWHG